MHSARGGGLSPRCTRLLTVYRLQPSRLFRLGTLGSVESLLRHRTDDLAAERASEDLVGLGLTTPLVLVVIHDLWTRQVIERNLTSRGYRVATASNGITGRLARSEQPNVVMLEMALPELSGEQVIEELQGTVESVGVIVVGASDDIGGVGLASGPYVDGELARQFDVAELIDRVDWVNAKRRVRRAGGLRSTHPATATHGIVDRRTTR